MASIRKKPRKDGGAYSYEVRIRRRGHPDLSETFHTEKLAKAWAAKMENAMNEGKTALANSSRFTLSDAIKAYRSDPACQKKENGRLDIIDFDLGKYGINSLNRARLQAYIDRFQNLDVPSRKKNPAAVQAPPAKGPKKYAASSIRKIYYTIKKVLEWHALQTGYALDSTTFKGMRVPNGWESPRDRRLAPDEEAKLRASALRESELADELIRLIELYLETALRRQELLLARWSDLTPEGGTLNIPAEHCKTRKARRIPLSKRAKEILTAHRATIKEGEARIFWQFTESSINTAFSRVVRRAGIVDFTIHDLRHEAITRIVLYKTKLSITEIMKITGHVVFETFSRYVNLRDSDMAGKMD